MILDLRDIIAQKDLSEVYFYDIKDNYFGCSLEICAGYYFYCKDKFTDKFTTSNNNNLQGSALLINIRLFRKDELYRKTIFLLIHFMIFKILVKIFLRLL